MICVEKAPTMIFYGFVELGGYVNAALEKEAEQKLKELFHAKMKDASVIYWEEESNPHIHSRNLSNCSVPPGGVLVEKLDKPESLQATKEQQ